MILGGIASAQNSAGGEGGPPVPVEVPGIDLFVRMMAPLPGMFPPTQLVADDEYVLRALNGEWRSDLTLAI